MPKRIRRALDDASTAFTHTDATLAKCDVILDELADLLDKLQDGVELELSVRGNPVPVTLKIKP